MEDSRRIGGRGAVDLSPTSTNADARQEMIQQALIDCDRQVAEAEAEARRTRRELEAARSKTLDHAFKLHDLIRAVDGFTRQVDAAGLGRPSQRALIDLARRNEAIKTAIKEGR